MDTYGWDLVYACRMDRVNDSLKAGMQELIVSFDYNDGDIEITGTFDAWRLVFGGADKLLRFETPIKTGTVTVKSLNQTFGISGIVPEMELQLSFVDNVSTANVKDLKFNCITVGKKPGDQTSGAVTLVTPDTGDKFKEIEQHDKYRVLFGVLHDNLPKLFIANRDKLAYVFAQVNLFIGGSSNWMTPKQYEYVYDQPVSGKTGYLGILCMVTDGDISSLPRKIDTALTSGDCEVFFMMSKAMFMQHVLLPVLPRAYGHGATAGNFIYKAGSIKNNGRLNMGRVKAGLAYYYPHLDSVTITVEDSEIRTSASGSFDITGLKDAYVTFSVGTTNKAAFDKSRKVLAFEHDNHPTRQYHKHIPKWEWIVGGPLAPIVDLVIYIVSKEVPSSVTKAVNAGGGLAAVATPVINWHGLKHFDVQDAGLSESFYMRGMYTESPSHS